MKISSYNVNGLRAALRHGLLDWIQQERPEVICLQETKCTLGQIDRAPLEAMGYELYLFPAERRGYSGVAILSRHQPTSVVYGMGMPLYDREARLMYLELEGLCVICVYHPSGSSGAERIAFKLEWLEAFSSFVRGLRQRYRDVVICGDFNICHEAIDIHDPVRNARVSGFLPEERSWMTAWFAEGYIDAFRALHPERIAYSWWSYRTAARERNKGWRIDYTILSQSLEGRLLEASIDTEARHSDHCPISLVLSEP